MALKKQSLLSSTDGRITPRLTPHENGGLKRVRMAASAGAELLIPAVPIAYNTSTQLWVQYTQPSDAAVYTITSNGTPATAGTFQLLIDGLAAVLAFDVTAAALQSAVNAILVDAGKGWQVAAAATAEANLGVASAVVTITFDEAAGAPSVEVDTSGLTGNAHVLAATDAGTQLYGTNKIAGFIFEDNPQEEGVQLDASDDVLAGVMHMGVAYRDDINTAAIRALLLGSPSEAELDAALREADLRKDGLIIRGLTKVR